MCTCSLHESAPGRGAGGLGLTSLLSSVRAGEARSCTSPHADVTRMAIQRRSCSFLLPMPTLLTVCTWGTGHGTCRPRWGASPAAKQGNRRLGRLPMRNGSRPGKAHPYESANSCIYNVCHTAPGDDSPPLAETFCGNLYRANCISLYVPDQTCPFTPVLPPAPSLLFMV